jgi:hypothetical protein
LPCPRTCWDAGEWSSVAAGACWPRPGRAATRCPACRRSTQALPDGTANRVALAWTVIGIGVTFWIVRTCPERLADVDRVYVEDETVAAGERP